MTNQAPAGAVVATGAPSPDAQEMTPQDMVRQVKLIQVVLREVMIKDQHYGVVPGCGDKPSLLKAGAEKLGLLFRLAPTFEIQETNLPGGHREYRVTCKIHHINSGRFIGSGVGVCTTMERKYRFRSGPQESTGRPVPKEYWDIRASNPGKAQEMLGGKGFRAGKVDGRWEIVRQGDPVEHDNPADYYNTVLKMGKKRAQVDAVITCTAASDIFTQDIEEDPGLYGGREPAAASAPPPQGQDPGPADPGPGASAEPTLPTPEELAKQIGEDLPVCLEFLWTMGWIQPPGEGGNLSQINAAQARRIVKDVPGFVSAAKKELAKREKNAANLAGASADPFPGATSVPGANGRSAP